MDLNEFILTMHSERDHVERWARMRQVVNNDLGRIVCMANDGRGTVCISSTGVYAVVNLISKVLITAYLPTVSKARRVYSYANEEMPVEIKQMLRRNERQDLRLQACA